jgi:mono/diheme cytochrome c family protein
LDFPRDIQPILDRHCVKCHGYEASAEGGPRAARLLLTGDHGPMFSHSYYMLTISRSFSDGRNQPKSNYAPRQLGSSNSKILRLIEEKHHHVNLSDLEKKTVRLWIESGAAYPGTYAALGTGMIGGYAENSQVDTDHHWPATKAAAEVIERRCASCHSEPGRVLPRSLSDERGVSFWQPSLSDPRLATSRHLVFNLSRPEKSLLLLAPLAKSAGGWGLCRASKTVAEAPAAAVFASTADPDYQKLLALCEAGKTHLGQIKRFDMAGFRPREDWIREMRRYGILPSDLEEKQPIDYYEVERAYWRSLWPRPALLGAH